MALEVNFDGIVGPTFNHGSFAPGNVASTRHAGAGSRPRQAALQGLAKMRALHDLGVPQAVLPPHFRPDLELARRLGFEGSEAAALEALSRTPRALAACYSASAMWTANAATVSPSADTEDGRVHLTPANLQNQLHRSIEAPTTKRALEAIFHDPKHFRVHDPLPASATLGDEGAANHTRLCAQYGEPGIELFVFGQIAAEPWQPKPTIFPARQTREACESLVRLHRLPASAVVLAHQNPEAIDAGVFHNDVIAVGDRDVFFFHEAAYIDTPSVLDTLARRFEATCGAPLRPVEVKTEELDVDAAVATYLFNSQLVALPSGGTALIAPKECEEHERARALVQRRVEDPACPIDAVYFHDVRQSMHGGGGPACLRLRVVLDDEELAAVHPGVRFDAELHERLRRWVETRYREELHPSDLADPALLEASRVALDELTQILGLGAIYPFQLP